MIAILLATLFQAAAPAADPLEPAWRGQVQCYGPVVARKACASIGSYAKDAGGVIQNKAVVLMNPEQPRIVMTSVAPVQVKAGAVCGIIGKGDLKAASFEVDGAPASPDVAERVRQAIEPAYAPIVEREICTTYVPAGDALKAEISLEGKRRSEMDMPVRWVPADAGFTVKP